MERKTPSYQKSHVNYSELLQPAKGWGNFISDRMIIWRLQYYYINREKGDEKNNDIMYNILYCIEKNTQLRWEISAES